MFLTAKLQLMHPLDNQLQNPLTRVRNQDERGQLLSLFPMLSQCPDRHFLALRPYLAHCPEKFFSQEAFTSFLNWLEQTNLSQKHQLQSYLNLHLPEISNALQFLREINSESWHDDTFRTDDDYELLRTIDKHIHSTYLRVIEGVLTPLIRVIAHFSRMDSNRGTEGLEIYSIAEELKNGPMENLTSSYDSLMRNGIGHGGITYLQNAIRYRDKKGHEEILDTSSIINLSDDLLDTCNGLAAALKIFLMLRRGEGYELPQELLLQELREETLAPWWSIEGCIQAEIAIGKQLLIYARPNSLDQGKVQYAAIQSGILAEHFAPGFDRYFISLRSPQAWTGWVAFDGQKIRELRLAGASDIEDYQGIVENNYVFYLPKFKLPQFLRKLNTILMSFAMHWPFFLKNVRNQLGIPKIIIREAKIHRNYWGSVLNGSVVLEDYGNQDIEDVVRKYQRKIMRAAVASARKKTGLLSFVSYLPLGWGRIAIFRKDYRKRKLANFWLKPDLVCTIQYQDLKHIEARDIMGSTIEAKGKWRIAWNKAWLVDAGKQI